VSDDRGSWSSVDPASGLYRAAHVGEFGGASYEELTDRTGFVVDGIGLTMKGGTDPTAPIDPYDDDGVTIENTSDDGRSTWFVAKLEMRAPQRPGRLDVSVG
jgi:hypothetical protein